MIDRDEMKEYIWEAIKEEIEKYCSFVIDKDQLSHETMAMELFPTQTTDIEAYQDEQANRYGLAIAEAWMRVTKKYEVYIKADYEVRTEFQLFPTLGDVFRYMNKKIAPEIVGKGDGYNETIY